MASLHGMWFVRAAGGLLWRENASGVQLAVVHRVRRGDWTLPKGMLDKGESWKAAAVREVREETGCEAAVTDFAGATWYFVRRTLKIVAYWNMALVHEGRLARQPEIDDVAWLSAAVALNRLDYESDRRLVARALRRAVRRDVEGRTAVRPRLGAPAGAGVALAVGVVLAVAVASPAKRRAMVAGGAAGLVGAASAVLAALAVGRQRRPRP